MTKERIIRVVTTFAAAGLILAMFVQSAIANLPNCTNCVEDIDIAANSVGASELKNDLADSIDANDIETGGVKSAEIANGSVKKGDLAANARVAGGEVKVLDSTQTTSTTATDLAAITVTAPAAGYIYVNVWGDWYLNLDVAANTSDGTDADLALCTTADTILDATCGEHLDLWWVDDEGDSPSSLNAENAWSLSRVIPVSAGANTLYLNAASPDGNTLNVRSVFATALFLPSTLTVGVAP